VSAAVLRAVGPGRYLLASSKGGVQLKKRDFKMSVDEVAGNVPVRCCSPRHRMPHGSRNEEEEGALGVAGGGQKTRRRAHDNIHHALPC